MAKRREAGPGGPCSRCGVATVWAELVSMGGPLLVLLTRSFFKRKRSRVLARVCPGCGYAEMFAADRGQFAPDSR